VKVVNNRRVGNFGISLHPNRYLGGAPRYYYNGTVNSSAEYPLTFGSTLLPCANAVTTSTYIPRFSVWPFPFCMQLKVSAPVSTFKHVHIRVGGLLCLHLDRAVGETSSGVPGTIPSSLSKRHQMAMKIACLSKPLLIRSSTRRPGNRDSTAAAHVIIHLLSAVHCIEQAARSKKHVVHDYGTCLRTRTTVFVLAQRQASNVSAPKREHLARRQHF